MRTPLFSALALCGLLTLAGTASLAATLQCQAHVNLVQGAEVMPAPPPAAPAAGLGAGQTDAMVTLAVAADGFLSFALAGPADYQVDVRLTALPAAAQWSDDTIDGGTRFNSRHAADGSLQLDFDAGAESARLILSVTYE